MILGKYNQTKTVSFRLFQVDGVDFEPAASFAAGDIKIMKDEGVEANTANLPTDEGQGYSLVLTAAEMSAARIVLYVVDQTATKVWLDSSIAIETYGNASAEHAFDLDTASTAQTADHTAGIADIPTVAELNARTLVAADYFNPATDNVAVVTTLAGHTPQTADHTAALADMPTVAEFEARTISPTAASNLEDTYDGTGYTNDVAPSTQSQVGNLAVGSAAISTVAESNTLTTGTESSGTYTDTETLNGVYHEHTDDAGALEVYYQFDVSGSGIAVETAFSGRINGGNDDVDVFAYNWAGASWDQVGSLNGTNGSADTVDAYNLLSRHTGSGANLGKVRIRFYAASGLTTATLRVDQLSTSYAVVSQSVGYADGAVWIDTVNGTAGTESYVNGTADKPVNTLASAITIAGNVGLSRYHVINGSTITFGESHDNETWIGANWMLALGGQSVSGAFITGAILSGTCTGAASPHFEHCEIGTVTLPPCRINGGSGFTDIMTLGSAGDFDIVACNSLVAGESSPTIDMGGAIGASNVSMRGWSGGLTIVNVAAGDEISLEGVGGTISVNGTGGDVHIRGIWEGVTDLSSAAVTLIQTAAMNRKSAAGYESSSAWIDTTLSNTGTIDYTDGTADNPVSTIAAATIIASSVGLKTFRTLRGSSITLAQTYNGFGFQGGGAFIALGGQDVGGCVFTEALISGIAAGSIQAVYDSSKLTNVTAAVAGFLNCSISGTLTFSSAGNYTLNNCYDSGDASPAILDFGAAIGSTHAEIHDWTGGLEIQNLGQLGTDTLHINGTIYDLIINANCTGGTITLAGDITVTDNSGGAVTVVQVNDSVSIAAILADTADMQPKLGTPAASISADIATRMAETSISTTAGVVDNVNAVDTRVTANTDQLAGDTVAATNLSKSAAGIEPGTAIAGTLSTTQMTTDLTEVTDDHYIGRIIIWTSGALKNQATDITDYTGATKLLTFTVVTDAPLATDTFVIV